jgi:hypothetical protein
VRDGEEEEEPQVLFAEKVPKVAKEKEVRTWPGEGQVSTAGVDSETRAQTRARGRARGRGIVDIFWGGGGRGKGWARCGPGR